MKLKIVEVAGKSYAEIQDGKPVYLAEDGKDIAFDAPHAQETIKRLNGEAKGHREAKEAAEEKLKAFDGIEEPETARKALETVKNLDQGALVTAGKVEEIKAAAKKAAEEQVAAAAKASNDKLGKLEKERESLQRDLYGEKVGGAFTRSKFVTDKVAVPPDMLQAVFGHRFKIENGKVIGYGADNQPIYSRARAGEIADFDEALESMVEAYPSRDSILKGTGASGGGAIGTATGKSGRRTMPRAQFNALDMSEQIKAAKEHEIVD